MLSGDYYQRDEPLFAVDLARKDARHAQAIANSAGVTMKNVQIADSLLQGVKEHMGAKGDIAGMVSSNFPQVELFKLTSAVQYGAKRKESGLPFENQ